MKTFTQFAFPLTLAVLQPFMRPDSQAATSRAETGGPAIWSESPRSAWSAKSRQSHQTEWSSLRYLTNRWSGRVIAVTNSFIEVASHLNVQGEDGTFQPSNPSLQITERGAESQNTAHRLALAPDIYSAGAVTIETEGRTFRAHPLCVGYWDPVDGRNVIFAEVQSSIGWLTASNEVVYSNCFKGLRASIRVRNSRSGVAQELIIHEQPQVTPESLGLSSHTRLELFSEIMPDGAWPTSRERTIASEQNAQVRSSMLEPEFTDASLTFGGSLHMGPGRAFNLGEAAGGASRGPEAPVGKRLLEIEGRQILIEAVEIRRVHDLLLKLPRPTATMTNAAVSMIASNLMASDSRRVLVPAPVARASDRRIKVPRLDERLQASVAREPGFILDYESVYGSHPSMTFHDGITYFISDDTSIDHATFIGGAVLKYHHDVGMTINQSLTMNATSTRPVLFTHRNDDTVGQPLNLGLPPSSAYAAPALDVNCSAANVDQLKHFRINQASQGIRFNGSGNYEVAHAQVLLTAIPFNSENNSLLLRNALLHGVDQVFEGNYTSATAEYVTVHQAFEFGRMRENTIVRNSLAIAVQDPTDGYTLENTAWEMDEVPTFETVGAGGHYLPENSPHRSAANPALIADQQFLQEIRRGTTTAPELKQGALAVDEVWPRRSIRDSVATALGYHYAPIDYACSIAVSCDRKLTIGAGCQIASFSAYTFWVSGGELLTEGSGQHAVQIFPFSYVQEQPVAWGAPPSITDIVIDTFCPQPGPECFQPEPRNAKVNLQFTKFERPRANANFFWCDGDWLAERIQISDCQFNGGRFVLQDVMFLGSPVSLTNNLFIESYFEFTGDLLLNVYNNTFIASVASYQHFTTTPWKFHDNLFDHCTNQIIYIADDSFVHNGHNAYVQGQGTLPGPGNGNVTGLAIIPYTQGPLGPYYTSNVTQLIDTGSRSAIDARLFAHTISSTARDSGTVDIGFHYPYSAAPRVYAGEDQTVMMFGAEITASLCGRVDSAVKGKLLVANDDWILTPEGFGHGPSRSTSARQYANNFSRWFAGETPSSFLVYSRITGFPPFGPPEPLNENPLRDAIESIGHALSFESISVVEDTNNFNLDRFLPHAAIFCAGDVVPNGLAGQIERAHHIGRVLTDYVNSGGSVYIAGGTQEPNEATAGLLWNPFLHGFGLRFLDTYNDVFARLSIEVPCSAIFQNISKLYVVAGNAIERLPEAGSETRVYDHADHPGIFGTYGEEISALWTQLDGPAAAQLISDNSPNTQIRFSVGGIYEFRLTGDYAGLTASDSVIVHVITSPKILNVSATPSSITLPAQSSVVLSGVVTDEDDLPSGRELAMAWEATSAPFGVQIDQTLATDPLATAHFARPGSYKFKLRVSDGLFTATSGELTVTVNAGMIPPVVNAGPDQIVEISDYVYLPGQVTDDDVGVSGEWTASGPGTVSFDDASSVQTMAKFSEPGVYTIYLTATDSQDLTHTDEAQIDVRSPLREKRFYDVDVVSVATGGMRASVNGPDTGVDSREGTGTLVLDGISGPVRKAYLYWHGPTDLMDSKANDSVLVNGRYFIGTQIGMSHNNGWNHHHYLGEYGPVSHPYANSQSYRADVTTLVAETGNGHYSLANLSHGQDINVNGASLIVFFSDGNSNNDHDVILVDGNDSNSQFHGGFDGPVHAIVAQPDSKLLVAGAFARASGAPRNRIARILPDGRIDPTFQPGSGANGVVRCIALFPDGKIAIGGDFTTINGITRNRVARLNSNGSLDSTFSPSEGTDDSVRAIAVKSGKAFIAGSFTHINGQSRGRLAMLNSDGSVDESFNPNSSWVNDAIHALVLDAGGRLLIGGDFTQVGLVPRSRIARLHGNGELDTGFYVRDEDENALTPDGRVNCFAVQADGRILAGGAFTHLGGGYAPGLFGVNANGFLDTTFSSGGGAPVHGVALLQSKVVVGGANYVQLLSANGANEKWQDLDGAVNFVLVTSDGAATSIVAGGAFTHVSVNGTSEPTSMIAKFNEDLTEQDATFHPNDGAWKLVFQGFQFAEPATLELHVSDGQHCVDDLFFSDPRIDLNGQAFIEPVSEPVPETAPQYPELNLQTFTGALTGDRFSSQDNLGLWDVMSREVTYSTVPQGANLITLNSHCLVHCARNLDHLERDSGHADAVSFVAALLKLPAGKLDAPINPAALAPLDGPPVARDDQFSIESTLGGRIFNVLGNDSSGNGKTLCIRDVTPATSGVHGTAAVVHNGSAIWYMPDPEQSGTVTFDYVIVDSDGQESIAALQIDVTQGPELLDEIIIPPYGNYISTAALSATSPSDPHSRMRTEGNLADFYEFQATEGHAVKFDFDDAINPELGNISRFHLYIRDLYGNLVASGTHTYPRPEAEPPWETGNFDFTHTFLTSGRHIVEVTTHDPNMEGAYTLTVSNGDSLPPRFIVRVDGLMVREDAAIDLGGAPSKMVEFVNVSDEYLSDTAISVSGNTFTVSPALLGPIPIGESRMFVLSLKNNLTAPPEPATLLIQNSLNPQDTLDGWQQENRIYAHRSALATRPGQNTRPVAVDDELHIYKGSGEVEFRVLQNDFDANGDALHISKLELAYPGGNVTTNSTGTGVLYTPDEGVQLDSFIYTVSDGHGGTDTGLAVIRIVRREIAIISPTADSFWNVGVPFDIYVATDAPKATLLKVELYVNGAKHSERFSRDSQTGGFTFSFGTNVVGFYSFKAVAFGEAGSTFESEPVRVGVGEPNGHPSIAEISSPRYNEFVREGFMDVFGTSDDEDGLPTKYTLRVFSRDSDTALLIKEQTVATKRVKQSLGQLDLTTLPNGLYDLELEVEQNATSTYSPRVRFALQSNLKIGQLAFSVEDYSLPGINLPISIVRTYDSLNKGKIGDFGECWSMAINNLEIELDEERASTPIDPDLFSSSPETEFFSMRVGGGRNVTLTLPDGRRTTFLFKWREAAGGGDVPSFGYQAEWVAPPGVNAWLAPMDNATLQFLPWQNAIPPFWAASGPQTPWENFDFRGYWLTNSDGTIYEIAADLEGNFDLEPLNNQLQEVTAYVNPKLRTIRARTGEHVEIGDQTIQHFTGGGTLSRSVYIQRNASGQVTEIYGPESVNENGGLITNPTQTPLVKYVYENGRLTEVHRLAWRAGAQSLQTNTMTLYEYDATHTHFIVRIWTGLSDGEWQLIGTLTPKVNATPDPQGRLTSMSDGGGGGAVTLDHQIGSRREVISDVQQNTTIHEYDLRGNVVRTMNALSEVTTRGYDTNDNVIAETDHLGNTATHGYGPFNHRFISIDPLGHVSTASHDRFGHLLSSRDARLNASGQQNGYTTSNDYDDSGENPTFNLTESRDAEGNATRYTDEPPTKLLSEVIDPLGNRAIHAYYNATEPTKGRAGDLKSVTVRPPAPLEAILSTTTYEYDAQGNRVKEIVSRTVTLEPLETEQLTTTYIYDAANRLIETIDPAGNRTHTVYTEAGKPEATFDKVNRRTEYLYDSRGNLIQTTYPADDSSKRVVERTVYDSMNRPVVKQERALVSAVDFYAVTIVTNGSRTIHDSLGRVVRTERLANVTTKLEEQEVGLSVFTNVVLITEPATLAPVVLSSTSTLYDPAGRVQASFDARGYGTFYGYDAAGRRTHATNALGQVTTFGFDENGNQTSFTDALGRTTDYEHDKLNRRTATIFPLLEGQTQQSQRTTLLTMYDQLGRRVAETNQDGIITRYGYDGLGRLTSVVNADDTLDRIETQYRYDELGNLLEQEDALDRKTKFLYDKLGRRIRRTLPEGQSELSFYDAIGNRTIHTNFNHEQVLEFKYDTFGRLKKKFQRDQEATPIAEFTYNPNGQRLTMKDQSTAAGLTSYEYYLDNRLKKKTVANGLVFQGSSAYLFQYNYDLNGNLTSLYAGTHQVQYQWDALNRLTNVVDEGLSSQRKNTSYQYDGVGNLKGYEYPNLVATSYEYDNLNRLKEMDVARGGNARASFQYELLKSGHRKNLTEEINGLGRQVLYGYDPLYRLVGETNANVWPQPWYPVPEVFYDEQPGYSDLEGYDMVGNRRKRAAGFGWGDLDTRTYAYNDNDWLTDHTYDANGNTREVTAVPDQTDEYDLDNRLIKRSTTEQVIEFVYDGDGNRVQKRFKTPDGQTVIKTIYYLVDNLNPTGYAQVWEEVAFGTDVNEDHRVCTFGHDLISQARPSIVGTPTHFHGYDGLGSVRFLTDTAGNITDTYTYDAFGILIYIDGLGTPNNYLFAGEQWDPDLRMYCLRARYLDPNLGRFWTRDSFDGNHHDPYSLHKYLYAHADPVNGIDPSGNMTLVEIKFVAAELAVLGTVILYRAAPALNRATIIAFEATSGGTVIIGGHAAAVALKQGTTLGGVGWSTWQYVGNLLKGAGKKIGTKKELTKALEGTVEQAHHLNQHAAFSSKIPYDDGVTVALEGGTHIPGSQHWKFHNALEAFWRICRQNGRKTVTNAEYDSAIRKALADAGFPPEEINALAKLADESRVSYGFHDKGGLQPSVPEAIVGWPTL